MSYTLRLLRCVTGALLAGLLFFGIHQGARADDIDIFTASSTLSAVPPNVLIVLDNSANWSANFGADTKFSEEIATLIAAINSLDTKINLGLMMFGETGAGNNTPVTSYIRYAVRNMTLANRNSFKSLIGALDKNGDKGSNAPYGFSLFEAFKYFGGGGTSALPQDAQNFGTLAFGGAGQKKRDYAGNATANTAGAIAGNAFANATSKNYVSPISDACQKNYVIFISNGLPQAGADSGNPTASKLLTNIGGNSAITSIPLPNNAAQGNIGDEYARLLYQTDVGALAGTQNIVTYAINVYDPAKVTGNDQANIVLLQSMTNQGHGRYFPATSQASLADALQTIFNEVLAVNTVFASVALPVSVNVRGTNLNQVYLGVFRADEDAAPRWLGNLKQYQLALDAGTSSVYLADATGKRAQSASSGFIVNDAVSFWTSSSTYWDFSPRGTPLSGSDSPDGPIVEKGGVAQRIRTLYPQPDSTAAQTRKIYTCTGVCLTNAGSALSTYAFNTTTIATGNAANLSAFGAADATELANIINWVRGKDNIADENIDGVNTDIRASIHGDVLHSKPAVINYNRSGDDNDVMVFYGANDGLFRAVKGGAAATDGYEKWAIVFKEFFGDLRRLRNNLPAITSSNSKPYFADGSVSVYQYDANNDGKLVAADGDKVYLYVTMRRGGRVIYAIDVSDPDDPKFMWRRDNTSTGYSELGQTWSEPKVRRVRAYANPVLIFGAGYDAPVEDQDPVPAGVLNSMGRGVFVVDALTGTIVWQAGPVAPTLTDAGEIFLKVTGMTYAIPSDVAVIDRNLDGYADRIYVGDTGGTLWRIDIASTKIAEWTVNALASVGYAQYGATVSRRKFLFPPDVAYGSDAGGAYDAVLIGSGDREHPFNGSGDATHPLANAVVNRYYMFRDRGIGNAFVGSTAVESGLYDSTANLAQDGTAVQQVAASNALAAAVGWYVTLSAGEKVVGGSATLAGTVFFNTNQPALPAPGVCGGNLGIARNYALNFENAAAKIPFTDAMLSAASRSTVRPGGGYPPSPVAVFVKIDGRIQGVVVSGTTVLVPTAPPIGSRLRTFWRRR